MVIIAEVYSCTDEGKNHLIAYPQFPLRIEIKVQHFTCSTLMGEIRQQSKVSLESGKVNDGVKLKTAVFLCYFH
jgi:hypothetical protein